MPAKSKPWTWLLFGVNFGRARRGKLLGHMQVQTTARYARLAADPVKDGGSVEYRRPLIRPPDRACSRSPPPAPLAAPSTSSCVPASAPGRIPMSASPLH